MNNVRQCLYHIYSYAANFLILILAKIQVINNYLLTLCQYRGPQHCPPLWNRALEWILIIIGVLCTRLTVFLTPRSATLQTKDPTVVTKHLHAELRPIDRSAVLRRASKPIDIPQFRTDTEPGTDPFQHQIINTCQLNNSILNHPSLNYGVKPSKLDEAILMSNTDSFEHIDIDTSEWLLEENKSANKEALHHMSEPVPMVASTDIELLHAALEAHKI